MYCMPCSDLSVNISICPRERTAVMIRLPSDKRWPPAVFVTDSANSLMSSWSENRTNNGSCVLESPTVVSVPKQIKCLSGLEIRANVLALGAPLIAVARVSTPLLGSQLNI